MNLSNVLVTGANGQLGSELRSLIQHPTSSIQHHNFYFTDRNELDITDRQAIEDFCTQYQIKIILNCAAYTTVDNAENDKENADRVNHLAVKYLAEIAKVNNIKLIHISTDYVFDGKNYRPYVETDETNPQSVYGASKLAGEKALMEINPPGAIIIRTSWVYSSFGNNFVKTMLRLGKERDELGVIFDQVGTPTYARDLAETILKIVSGYREQDMGYRGQDIADRMKDSSGEDIDTISNIPFPTSNVEIYHYSNEGVASWYDFAKAIFELSNIDYRVRPIETKEYPTPATRPYYSLLNKAKIKKDFNITIPYWKESLQICLQRILDNEDRI